MYLGELDHQVYGIQRKVILTDVIRSHWCPSYQVLVPWYSVLGISAFPENVYALFLTSPSLQFSLESKVSYSEFGLQSTVRVVPSSHVPRAGFYDD